jgi:hypothetical protein
MADSVSRRPDYERSDVDPRLLLSLAFAAAAFLVIAPYLLSAIYPAAREDHPAHLMQMPPEPRLQVSPTADLLALRRSEDARLSSYGWGDRTAGIVRIPIARAIELSAERGLPGWTKP